MNGTISGVKECILVVDDCQDNLFLMQLILENQGYQVEIADSGSQALSKMNCQRFDLILLDLMMPKMNGYEVIKYLRNNLPLIPVFLVTANKYVTKKQAIAAGANGIIYKPIDINLLTSRIAKVFDVKATS